MVKTKAFFSLALDEGLPIFASLSAIQSGKSELKEQSKKSDTQI
jgi:hypothetical protein